MRITAHKVESTGGDYDDRQGIKLGRGIHGAVFSQYSKPKMYANNKSGEQEEKFYMRFLVVADGMARPLPHFGEAFIGVRTTLFYDDKTMKQSRFVEAMFGLLANKGYTQRQIADGREVPDLNELIGFPVNLYLTPSTTPNKAGIYFNRIESIDTPTPELRTLVKGMYPKFSIEARDDGSLFLADPKPVYEEDAPKRTAVTVPDDEPDDGIPF